MNRNRVVLALVLTFGVLLAGAGTATAAAYLGLLPGATPTAAWTQVDQDYRTYYQDCGPIVLNTAGYEQSPAYARWIESLIKRGWKGHAGDTMEALYPRGC